MGLNRLLQNLRKLQDNYLRSSSHEVPIFIDIKGDPRNRRETVLMSLWNVDTYIGWCDAANKMDRGMFGALYQSGYRPESVAEIWWDSHVVHIGDPTVGIIPDVRRTLRIHFRLASSG